jgi:hypothetical protein
MRTSLKETGIARQLGRRGLQFVLLAVGLVILQASECSKEDFYDALDVVGSLTGDIFGTVTLDGDAASGATVTVRQGSTVIDTETTGGDGSFRFSGIDSGTYLISTTLTGANCADQTAVVEANEETEVDVPCTTPEPQTGTVAGTVTVNGAGESGVAVTVREGTTVVGTATTGEDGTYSITDVPEGAKTVSIATPDGATCDDTDQEVDVPAGGTATANFACTRPSGGFNVTLGDLRWEHTMPGVESVECKIISTSPAQAGATWSATVNGPTEGGASGVISGQTFGGTLDASGRAELRVRINRFGTYVNNVTVIAGSVTQNATASVTVGPAANTCVLLPSSARFKRGIVALLPDDVRPLGLNPVAFRYVEPWGDPSIPRIGLIAEEVAEVFPEAVLLDAQGRPQAIDYGVLAGYVAASVLTRGARAIEDEIAALAAVHQR